MGYQRRVHGGSHHTEVTRLQQENAALRNSLEIAHGHTATARGGELRMMSPKEIRFTHGSISFCFRNSQTIDETIKRILANEMSFEDLPPLELTTFNDSWYSLSNRRLFVLRVLA